MKRIRHCLLCSALLLLIGKPLVYANTISINFVGGGGITTPSPMAPSEVAGVVAVSNWNNASGATGSLANLADNTGAVTGVSVNYSAHNTWSSGLANSPGNDRMMAGYLDTTNTSTTSVVVSGLNVSSTYSIYVYAAGDGAGRSGIYTIGSQSFSLATQNGTNFTTFMQGTATNPFAPGTGNYMVFTVTGQSSFTLTATPDVTAGGFRSPLNGLQVARIVAPPSAPTSLTAGGLDHSVILNWNAPVGVSSYTIRRSLTSGGPYSTIATSVTSNAYTDTGLTNGTTYYYIVTAVNQYGSSPNSNEASAKPAAAVVGNGDGLYGTYYTGDASDFSPEATTPILYDIVPTVNFNTENNGINYNPASWPADVPYVHFTAVWAGQLLAPYTGSYVFVTISDDGSRLSLDRKDGNGLQTIVSNVAYQGPTAVSSVMINLTAGQKYNIKMEYFQGVGGETAQLLYALQGTPFQIIPQTQLFSNFLVAPPAPTNLVATGGNHLVNLAWNSTPFTASYKVLRSTTPGGPYTQIGTSVTPNYTDTGRTNGQLYYYVVQAMNYVGISGNSNEASATPFLPTLVLHYDFENGPSGIDPDPITDISGHGNNGIAVGGDADFTHDSAQGSYAGVTSDTTHYLALPNGFDFGNQFTFYARVKLNDAFGIQTILATNGLGGSTSGFALYVNDNNTQNHAIIFETNYNPGSGNLQTKTRTAPGVFPLGDGKYHAVTAVVDRTLGTVSLYLDGTRVLANGLTGKSWPTSSGANRLGEFTDGTFVAVDSQFDEVRVYASDIGQGTVKVHVMFDGVLDLSQASPGAMPCGHYEFRIPGTLMPVVEGDGTVMADGPGSPGGSFSVPDIPPGYYDVAFKPCISVRACVPGIPIFPPPDFFDVTLDPLMGGDADDNNTVDISDFAILINAYFGDYNNPASDYNSAADFNLDGKNDIADFGLLVSNFGISGVP